MAKRLVLNQFGFDYTLTTRFNILTVNCLSCGWKRSAHKKHQRNLIKVHAAHLLTHVIKPKAKPLLTKSPTQSRAER